MTSKVRGTMCLENGSRLFFKSEDGRIFKTCPRQEMEIASKVHTVKKIDIYQDISKVGTVTGIIHDNFWFVDVEL